jgi:plastocyanin
MSAYPGVQANYPTVFDPNTGLPQGPKHHRPAMLHLGPAVSIEAEADVGPDADGVNNIVPPANVADLDWFDDGAQLSNLSNCQPARADVRVFVSAPAAAWFAQQERLAYLNIWLDSNRDGDWADGFTCVDEAGQNKEVVEHILIDYPIDVAALGAGLSNIPNIVTNAVGWPQQWTERPAWVRFTLSEEPSNKTLTFGAIQYGDGRGYANAFRTGETEDYLLQPQGGEDDGPNMAVRLVGQIVQHTVQEDNNTGQTNMLNDRAELRLKIDYANLGSRPAQNGVLTLSKDERIRDVEIYVHLGPGIQPDDFTDSDDKLTIALPDLAPGASSSIVLGFGPLPAANIAAAAVGDEYNATVRIELDGDVDTSNNEASVTVTSPGVPLRLAASVEGDELLRKADTTCHDYVTLQGLGEAMRQVDLYVNDVSNVQLQFDANGVLDDVLVTNLTEGRNRIWIGYAGGITSPRDSASGQAVGLMVNTDLPVDPISLLLTDSQGRQYHPPTLGWARNALQADQWRLRHGETYTVRINSCVDDPNLTGKLLLGDLLLTTLRDDDGDGQFTGSFTYQAPVQNAADALEAASQLRFLIETGGAQRSFNAEVSPLAPGKVTDAQTAQPLATASVAALTTDGAISSDPNPQTTGSDGAFSFAVTNGVYRLDIAHSGYQSYRTGEIVVTDGILAADVALSPAIADPANHVVYITATGFQPAQIEARPGDVIMWVNADLADHSTVHSSDWDSGVLAPGQVYKVRLNTEGSYSYTDSASSSTDGIIVVKTAGEATNLLYLPALIK